MCSRHSPYFDAHNLTDPSRWSLFARYNQAIWPFRGRELCPVLSVRQDGNPISVTRVKISQREDDLISIRAINAQVSCERPPAKRIADRCMDQYQKVRQEHAGIPTRYVMCVYRCITPRQPGERCSTYGTIHSVQPAQYQRIRSRRS
jgi:hypothetical protein